MAKRPEGNLDVLETGAWSNGADTLADAFLQGAPSFFFGTDGGFNGLAVLFA